MCVYKVLQETIRSSALSPYFSSLGSSWPSSRLHSGRRVTVVEDTVALEALSPSYQPPIRSSTPSFRTSVPDCSSLSSLTGTTLRCDWWRCLAVLCPGRPPQKCCLTELFMSGGRVCASRFQPCAFTRQGDFFLMARARRQKRARSLVIQLKDASNRGSKVFY